MSTKWALGLAALLGTSFTTARADEEKIPLDKVPKPVMTAFKEKFPGAEIKTAIKEVEDGKTLYEIESTQKGLTIDAVLSPDGKFVEIERELKTADLPAAVSAAAKAKYPKGKATKAEEVTKGDAVTYEVTVDPGEGKAVVLSIDKTGKILEEEKG